MLLSNFANGRGFKKENIFFAITAYEKKVNKQEQISGKVQEATFDN